jgi:hypothetical protein
MTAAVCFIAAFSSNCPRDAFCSTSAARQAVFPLHVQEARYQFSGYIQIGKALRFRATENAKRLGRSATEIKPMPSL